MSKFAYIRVSSRDQNEERQLLAIAELHIPEKNIYIDHQSGKDFNRPAYRRMVRRMKAFAAEKLTSAGAAKAMEDHKKARLRRNRFSNVANIGFGAAMQGMYLIGAVYCAHGIMIGQVTYGTLTAVMQLIGQVQGPFANISGYLPRWYAMTASAERLMEVEGFADDVQATAAQ